MTAESPLRAVSRTLVGPPDQVRNVLVNASRRGRLVSASPARRVGAAQVRVDLVIMEPATAPRPAERLSKPRSSVPRYTVPIVAGTAALGALAAVGALIAALVQWVTEHLALIAGAGVLLAVIALILARLTRGHACTGLHCGGCGR